MVEVDKKELVLAFNNVVRACRSANGTADDHETLRQNLATIRNEIFPEAVSKKPVAVESNDIPASKVTKEIS